jgi:UDP-N-acetylmuramyl pentapeptide phosphotransferase/UDP-N-acetylglucosamine-1-phosphate transferase/glycosyltransferase involved in cell wall biosynthesis
LTKGSQLPTDQRFALAFGLALAITLLLTPAAIWLARQTGFFDHPEGYKGHRAPTPYLGGLAVGAGIAIPAIMFGGAAMEYSPLALCAAALWLVGTVDDRIGLNPGTRVIVEVAVAVVLWATGLGWGIPGAEVLGLAFTVLWVVGLVNAYNLMDNMDGAAAGVACVSAAGIALVAALAGRPVLAAFALTVAGACAGFLWFNLAAPAKIFLGDGGSMPLGFLIAAAAMSVPVSGDLGVLGIVALAPVAGLPILDTCLVMVSRRRRRVALLSGGRDHLTHRLRAHLASPRAVTLVLATAQAALCGLALTLTHLSPWAVIVSGLACAAGATVAVWALETRLGTFQAVVIDAGVEEPKVRVLRVIARLNMGGPAHHVSLLSGMLDPDRYETLLLHGEVGSGEASLAEVASRSGAKTRVVRGLRPELRPLDDLRAFTGLVREMRAFRPDIVHTHTAKAGMLGRLAAVVALRPRPVIVHTYHGHVLEGYFGKAKSALYRGIETALARFSDRLIGVSSATVDDLVRLKVAPRSKFSVVPIGLDLDPFLHVQSRTGSSFRAEVGTAPGEILLTFVGRLVQIKRVDVLLRAVARARQLGAPVRLAIVGDGERRAELEGLAAELSITDCVNFAGYRADVTRVAAASDIAVLSSDNEGTPVSLIEAGAAGCPAVSTAVGGVRDVVTPDSGMLVERGDAEGLGTAIARLAADPAQRARMGGRARDHTARRFIVDRLLGDADNLYRGLLAPVRLPRQTQELHHFLPGRQAHGATVSAQASNDDPPAVAA